MYESINVNIGDSHKLNEENIQYIENILTDNSYINIPCLECKNNNPFEVIPFSYIDKSKIKISFNEILMYNEIYESGRYKSHFLSNNQISIGYHNVFEEQEKGTYKYFNNIVYIDYTLSCRNKKEHLQKVILKLVFKDNGEVIIIKIGQDPINYELVNSKLKKYKKQLDKIDAYKDYKKSIQNENRSEYISACVYLRRIYEKIINYYLLAYNDTKLYKIENEKKIEMIKKNLNPMLLNEYKISYSLLSTAIHELSDLEILEFYDSLKQFIDLQLLYEKSKYDEEIAINELKRDLSDAHERIKSKI